MEWYKLSRQWFDFCFENPEKISPWHWVIYFFAIEHCNRLWWKKKFWFPSQMVMEAVWIKNWRTYTKYLNDLVDWGFLEMIQYSKNQYSSNIIAIVENTTSHTKALDKALQKHSTKHSQSTVSINKQETTNKKQETSITSKIKIYEDSSFEYWITKLFITKQLELWNTSFMYLYKKNWEEELIQKWCDEVRKLKEIDKYTESQIDFIIKYLFENDFWREQISSMEKFRKKNKSWIPYFVILINEAKKTQQNILIDYWKIDD